ncbi:MAG: hypothetical protein IT427_03655 [Pirellulales bacterium]|nr:hypothetical protein [Pirellulales bacterium]
MKGFTPAQKRIVNRIRELFRQRQPLNISAMKRHHPKLLAEVMSLKHFRGWRKALQAAGISYGKIKVELLDHCVCAICGTKLLTLDAHLRSRHNLSKQQYLRKFPNEETAADEVRAERTGSLRRAPHWEPVWSREYMIDYLIYKQEHDEDLSPWTIYREESAVHANIKKYFGSYRAGVEAAGIDYAKIRVIELTEAWTPEKVLERIRRLHRKKPLRSTTDIRLRDSRLYDSCHRYFGGPVAALEAAGIPYIQLKNRRSRKWTHGTILRTIRTLHVGGASLEPRSLTRHLDGQADELLAVAEQRFGSWKQAVRAAGIKPQKRKQRST